MKRHKLRSKHHHGMLPGKKRGALAREHNQGARGHGPHKIKARKRRMD